MRVLFLIIGCLLGLMTLDSGSASALPAAHPAEAAKIFAGRPCHDPKANTGLTTAASAKPTNAKAALLAARPMNSAGKAKACCDKGCSCAAPNALATIAKWVPASERMGLTRVTLRRQGIAGTPLAPPDPPPTL